MTFMNPVVLTGELVRLEPLAPTHVDDLRAACEHGDLAALWYASVPSPARVEDHVAEQLQAAELGILTPFVTRRLVDGRVIGMTAFCNPLPRLPAVEIGGTWNIPSAWRTGTNTNSKQLLLRHAFEVWGCRRVAFRTAWFNSASRAAIERLGAIFEGRIRQDRITREGIVTDSAQYSITDVQWPAVRIHLAALTRVIR